jgi:hypothetical protein
MSDIEKARQVFEKAGLAFPTIPEKLAEQLKEQSKWVFSTRPIDEWPYFLNSYVKEAEKPEVDDYVVLCHAGHGVNSYAIHYYLVQGSLRMFLQLSWGGIYSDESKDAARIRDCFSLADQIASMAKTVGPFQAGTHLTVVVSNFGGSYWLPPGKSRRGEASGDKGTLQVLTQTLTWLKRRQTKMQRNVSKIDPKLNLGLHELANLSTGDGSLLTIPFTKMRKRYRDLQGLNTAEQLKEAQAALAADIAEDFAKSVQAFEPYKNFQPFYSIRRPPLKTPVDITRTEDFASVLKDQAGGQIQSDPSLGFQYVERELVPARTTGLSRYSNGESKRRIIRFDLLLAGELPILGELKLPKDNASAFYAFIQLLASASELATAHQRARLFKFYPELPNPLIPRFDLYMIFYRFNKQSKPKMEILDRTCHLAEEILRFQDVGTHIRRIVALV